MSNRKKLGELPQDPPATSGANASLTPAEFQEWMGVLKHIQDNRWVVPAVIAAGLAAILEIIHLVWLFGKWLYYFRQ